MANPSEPPKPKEAHAGASRQSRQPILPTVFVRSPVLHEQMRGATAPELANHSLSALSNDITKKSGELRERLRELRHAPALLSPHTVQEAETVLTHADRLLATLPGGFAPDGPGASKELLCRSVDVLLMLDAANRALCSP